MVLVVCGCGASSQVKSCMNYGSERERERERERETKKQGQKQIAMDSVSMCTRSRREKGDSNCVLYAMIVW
jgi:hypothetical protein